MHKLTKERWVGRSLALFYHKLAKERWVGRSLALFYHTLAKERWVGRSRDLFYSPLSNRLPLVLVVARYTRLFAFFCFYRKCYMYIFSVCIRMYVFLMCFTGKVPNLVSRSIIPSVSSTITGVK